MAVYKTSFGPLVFFFMNSFQSINVSFIYLGCNNDMQPPSTAPPVEGDEGRGSRRVCVLIPWYFYSLYIYYLVY